MDSTLEKIDKLQKITKDKEQLKLISQIRKEVKLRIEKTADLENFYYTNQ